MGRWGQDQGEQEQGGWVGAGQREKELDQGNGSRSRAMGDRAPSVATLGHLQGWATSTGAVSATPLPRAVTIQRWGGKPQGSRLPVGGCPTQAKH